MNDEIEHARRVEARLVELLVTRGPRKIWELAELGHLAADEVERGLKRLARLGLVRSKAVGPTAITHWELVGGKREGE